MATCHYHTCKTRPAYNFEDDKRTLYCAYHKKEGMVNVKNKTCCEEGCKKQPSFNIEGNTKGLYCSQHKKEGMVNVKKEACCEPGCKKQPNFNMEGNTKGLYCSQHKKEGMIDVKHKTCCIPHCKKQPNFNMEEESTPMYCVKHKRQGMIDIKNKTCCEPGCKKQPNFNMEGKKRALSCAVHKTPGMINVINKKCKSEWCLTHVQNKYDGFCIRCFIHLFPDKPVSRNYKTKEYTVVEFVTSKFPEVHWIADKVINAGCSKRRPDLLLDLGYQILIVEIDENQHIDYDCSCENKRIMELSQDTGHRPIIFIRFNPDKYIHDGKTITSCWGTNQKGICVVKKSKQREWEERLSTLEQQVNYWINSENKTDKTIETIQLYYDT